MWPFGRGGLSGAVGTRLGQRGEKLAARHLRRGGLKVLARNYRCPAGEADIIVLDRSGRTASDAETIAFVEVKTRTSARQVSPESAVDARKRRQLARVAEYYLAHHDAGECSVRFDVVAVVLAAGAKPEIRHIVDAFAPAGLG